ANVYPDRRTKCSYSQVKIHVEQTQLGVQQRVVKALSAGSTINNFPEKKNHTKCWQIEATQKFHGARSREDPPNFLEQIKIVRGIQTYRSFGVCDRPRRNKRRSDVIATFVFETGLSQGV